MPQYRPEVYNPYMIRPEVPESIVLKDSLATDLTAHLAEAISERKYQVARIPYARAKTPAWLTLQTEKITFAVNPFSYHFFVTPGELNPRKLTHYFDIMKSRNAWNGQEISQAPYVWAREKVMRKMINIIAREVKDIPEEGHLRRISELLEFKSGMSIFGLLGRDKIYSDLHEGLSSNARDKMTYIDLTKLKNQVVLIPGDKAGVALGIFKPQQYGYTWPKQIRIFSNVSSVGVEKDGVTLKPRERNTPTHQTTIDYWLNSPNNIKGHDIQIYGDVFVPYDFKSALVSFRVVGNYIPKHLKNFELPPRF